MGSSGLGAEGTAVAGSAAASVNWGTSPGEWRGATPKPLLFGWGERKLSLRTAPTSYFISSRWSSVSEKDAPQETGLWLLLTQGRSRTPNSEVIGAERAITALVVVTLKETYVAPNEVQVGNLARPWRLVIFLIDVCQVIHTTAGKV